MKKLGKLTISPEKMMVNEELINLKGGYGPIGRWCYNGQRPSENPTDVAVLCYNCMPKFGIIGLGGGPYC